MINSFTGDYAFLSNMYPCEIECKGHKFPSSEHLYQWLKVPDTQEGQWWKDKIREAVNGEGMNMLGKLLMYKRKKL